MMFRTMLESPHIKLTIFPKSAPALGLSAFAALPFSSSFWAFGFIYESVDEKKKEADAGKNLLSLFHNLYYLVFLNNRGKFFSLVS